MITSIQLKHYPVTPDGQANLYQVNISAETYSNLNEIIECSPSRNQCSIDVRFPENICHHYEVHTTQNSQNVTQFWLKFTEEKDNRGLLTRLVSYPPVCAQKTLLAKQHVEGLLNRLSAAKTNSKAAIKHKIEVDVPLIRSTPLIITEDGFIGALTPSHFLTLRPPQESLGKVLFLFDLDDNLVSHGYGKSQPRPQYDTYQLDPLLPEQLSALKNIPGVQMVLLTNSLHDEGYVPDRLNFIGLSKEHFDKLDCRSDTKSTNKGERLEKLLKNYQEEGYVPDTIIFFDDQSDNLKAVRKITDQLQIRYIGVQTFAGIPISCIKYTDAWPYCDQKADKFIEKAHMVDKTVEVNAEDDFFPVTRKKTWIISEQRLLDNYNNEPDILAYFMLTTRGNQGNKTLTAKSPHQGHTHNASSLNLL